MNRLKSSLLIMPALALAASPAGLQPALAQNAMAPGRGDITMDQFVARQTARIMAADTDGDGRVSAAEFVALAGTRPGTGGRDPSRLFDAMDTNHDGYLDKDEIHAALEKRFHRMDLNGDGIVTPDERMAARTRQRAAEPASMPPAAQP